MVGTALAQGQSPPRPTSKSLLPPKFLSISMFDRYFSNAPHSHNAQAQRTGTCDTEACSAVRTPQISDPPSSVLATSNSNRDTIHTKMLYGSLGSRPFGSPDGTGLSSAIVPDVLTNVSATCALDGLQELAWHVAAPSERSRQCKRSSFIA